MIADNHTRRGFLRALAGAAVAAASSGTGAAAALAGTRPGAGAGPLVGPGASDAVDRGAGRHTLRKAEHPDPRPDVDGSNVLTAEELSGHPDLIELFDGIARIPHIADGIGCACGCAADPSIRSLLTCYEKSSRMAMFCEICQSEGRMVVRLHENGRTLDQIRAALDARFGR